MFGLAGGRGSATWWGGEEYSLTRDDLLARHLDRGRRGFGRRRLQWLIGRLIPVELRRSRHDVGGAIFAQIGILYSVLLAFVFSEVWGEYNIAAQAINAECGALHGAAMVAHALPGGSGAPVIAAVVRYDRLVLDAEWPAMARREASNEATRAFQAMIEAAASVSGLDADHSGLRGQIVSLLADAHAARETRTFQIKQALPLAVWAC